MKHLSTYLASIAVALPALLLASGLQAQGYPNRPIRMIVPFPPGGIVDLNGRAVSKIMEEKLGVPIVIDNRAGAGGLVGTVALANATPDGYTLGTIVPSTASRAFQKDPSIDVLTAIVPIGSIYIGPLALTTNAQTPAKNLKDFITYAKANPGKLNIGVSSGPPALAGAVFASLAGIKIERIEYKGAAPAMTALLADEVQANFGAISQFTSLMEAGRVVPLAVGGDQRMPAIPNVPTMAELGYPGVKPYTVHAVMAPAGVPQAVVTRLLPVMKEVVASPELDKLFRTSGKVLAVGNDELMRLVREEIDFWLKAGEIAGYKP